MLTFRENCENKFYVEKIGFPLDSQNLSILSIKAYVATKLQYKCGHWSYFSGSEKTLNPSGPAIQLKIIKNNLKLKVDHRYEVQWLSTNDCAEKE